MSKPGNYEQDCEFLLSQYKANLVVVGVVGGSKGNGFSVSVQDPHLRQYLPCILRSMADSIEKELATQRKN